MEISINIPVNVAIDIDIFNIAYTYILLDLKF